MRLLMGIAIYGVLLSGLMSTATCAQVPDDVRQRIAEAMPADPIAQPVAPRRLLVTGLTRGFYHDVIPVGIECLCVMADETDAFELTVTDDVSYFEPASLARFDAVCFMNTTGEVFRPANFGELDDAAKQKVLAREKRLQQSLVEFVKRGGGLVGFHAATDTLYEWPEWGEMIGGYFAGHPWNEEVTIKVDDPTHPVVGMYGGRSFKVADEIYQFRAPYSRDNLRVLLSLDAEGTDMGKDGMARDDGDYAVSWVREYGHGRVFYTSLGHRHDIFWNKMLLPHFLAGIQYALGDLPADATPSNRVQPWQTLFDGSDLDAWTLRGKAWQIDDEGAMAREPGGEVWTKQRFGDFILECEYKISPGGNSGIFFRTDKIEDCVQTGIEVQVLDSHGRDPGKHDASALYDIKAPRLNASKPAGEWNHCVIGCQGSRIWVYFNGQAVQDVDLDLWTTPHNNPDGTRNKFRTAYKDMPREGHIGFQDHGNPVWYRNIRIRELPPRE